ncbi:MAG TPA: tRNA pseudouridine(38-40) synthase TruA, partial [Planctomycetaceae bacterium]|nr:tRNA pseudouridine(38-40) synthase TruA [Planctomycetaceae bacterium]
VGVGRAKPDWIPEVFTALDRRVAGATAPPQGLCLTKVLYD